MKCCCINIFFFSSRRRHTRCYRDWSSDVCSSDLEKTQREYYLNEQLKAIQKELGEGDEGRDEMNELEERIRKTKLSKEARDKAMAEVKKLRSMSPMSAEATVVRNYLDWLLSIPWKKRTKI